MKAPSTKASKASTVAKASSGSTARVGKKTRAQISQEIKDSRSARKIPRVTVGTWTFEKVKTEAELRGFEVDDNAEMLWNMQSCTPQRRQVLMTDGRAPTIDNIVSGNTRSTPPTTEEREASKAKRTETIAERGLGQNNWMESAATLAAMKILDPENELLFEILPDGLGADCAVQDVATGLYTGIQVKSGENGERQTTFGVNKADGGVGGRYESLVIIGVLLTDMDRDAIKASMTTFDSVPAVSISDLFLFGNATEFPNNTLKPYPRKKHIDKYGDHRYTVGFDSEERLDRMRQEFKRLVHEKAIWRREQLWFGIGPGTPNPVMETRHQQEVRNCEALSRLVGFNNLRSPKLQNETTDVVWVIGGNDVKISLKTSSLANGGKKEGFKFDLKKHPNSHFCDFVFAFYRDSNGNRTHISVINASRAYIDDKTCFCWSLLHNKDVLDNKIDLRAPDALQKLKEAVGARA